MKETFSAKLTDYLNEETIGSFGKKKRKILSLSILSASAFYPCFKLEVEFTE